jgi:hypothetical protein
LIPGAESRGVREPGLILQGRAEVVRVEKTLPGPFGVACRLNDYRVVRAGSELPAPVSIAEFPISHQILVRRRSREHTERRSGFG